MVDILQVTEDLSEKSLNDLFMMIPERVWPSHSSSKIEIVDGCMFSGKTEEMIRRIKRARIAKQPAQIFKPIIDVRYGGTKKVNSHDGIEDDAIPVANSKEILINLIQNKDSDNLLVIGIDEVQFLDNEITDVVLGLRDKGFRIVMAGLNLDFRGEPFGPISKLLTYAEEITKLHAICTTCGEDADYTQRIINGEPAKYDSPIILVGAAEAYEARCREHHLVPR